MFRVFLSWRWLRGRRTNLIGIVGIFVGVMALITILSIMTGFLEQSRETLRGSLADVLITPALQLERADGRPLPRSPEPILELLADDPRVASAAPHLVTRGLLAQEGRGSSALWANSQFSERAFVTILGIDPGRELATTELGRALREAPRYGMRVADPDDPFAPPPGYRPEGRPRASVVLGDQLFRAHQLDRGDQVELLTRVRDPETGEHATVNRKFVVAGTLRSRENEIDLERVYLERAELQSFLGDQLEYSEILVRLKDYERDARAVVADLRRELDARGLIQGGQPELEVRTWEEFRATLLGAIRNERVLMALMLSLVLLVAGFTIFAILSMMVTEKRRDIGVLTALGATPPGVLRLFLLIALWDALLGASLGTLAGCLTALHIDDIERWLARTMNIEIFDRDVYMFDHIPSVVEPWRVGLIVLGAFVCALCFAALPAWRAARLDPLDALRYE